MCESISCDSDRIASRRAFVLIARRAALALLAITTPVACNGETIPELGAITCDRFGAGFNVDGQLTANFDDCTSDEGQLALRVYTGLPCSAECLVFRFNRGDDKAPEWKWAASCETLPASTGSAAEVGAFIDEVCGWRVESWEDAEVCRAPSCDGCDLECVSE